MWQATLGLSVAAFFAGVTATRTVYKAGQVDALKGQIETLQEQDKAKDALNEKYKDLTDSTQQKMSELSATLVDLSLRQPKHTERITETFKDAPTQYAEFDPNQCLSYVFPDGMRNSLDTAIKSHLASLPEFNSRGRRVIRIASGEDFNPQDDDELAGGIR